MAATFEQDWRSKNRPALLAAYNTLSDLHTHLVNNINQQTSASAAEGGWTAERAVGDFENALTGVGLVGMTGLLAGTPIGGAIDFLERRGDWRSARTRRETRCSTLARNWARVTTSRRPTSSPTRSATAWRPSGGAVFDVDPEVGAGLYAAGSMSS